MDARSRDVAFVILARVFWGWLAPRVPGLSRVGVIETAKNRFEYRGEEDGLG